MNQQNEIIQQTRNWVSQVIVKLNFCPFARPVVESGGIHYHLTEADDLHEALQVLIEQCKYLDEQPEIKTGLVIYAHGFDSFDEFLDLVDLANPLLETQGYEGIYQLANFHPDYCFEGELPSDPANYTNRSPYPMLHIIREADLEQALESYPDPEAIPARNIALAREMGLAALQSTLENCKRPKEGGGE
ncbi:MAG: DUF1415 domain-containing protein [Gammaproteobacteria bacterium]|nr:DUF1415 domain-containing protein [Gammaproteobacteria bacterium]MCF6230767.1 DUF1415 domain-containing protein [Gammaproteobacteria bacterium]